LACPTEVLFPLYYGLHKWPVLNHLRDHVFENGLTLFLPDYYAISMTIIQYDFRTSNFKEVIEVL